MSEADQLVTAEGLQKLPHDDYRYELMAGRVIRMSPVDWLHGATVACLIARLRPHVEAAQLGRVVTDVGFILARNPDTVRAPDLAFVRRDRIPPERGFFDGAPDLAVEVLSVDDRPTEVLTKVDEYLTYGVPLVLVLDPDQKTVCIFRRLAPPILVGADDELDVSDVIPGFRCPVREVFE
jgi:Uma2 family endonuclease